MRGPGGGRGVGPDGEGRRRPGVRHTGAVGEQSRLFDASGRGDGAGGAAPFRCDLPDADVRCWPTFFAPGDRDRLFASLLVTTAWRQDSIAMYGKPVPIPRLQAWYGDPGRAYTYSGIEMEPAPWTPALLEVKAAIEPV